MRASKADPTLFLQFLQVLLASSRCPGGQIPLSHLGIVTTAQADEKTRPGGCVNVLTPLGEQARRGILFCRLLSERRQATHRRRVSREQAGSAKGAAGSEASLSSPLSPGSTVCLETPAAGLSCGRAKCSRPRMHPPLPGHALAR